MTTIRKPLTLLCLALSLAGPTRAGDKFLYADILPQTDAIREVDLDDVTVQQNVLDTQCAFVRGLVVDGAHSGWYISAFAQSGTPTGLFRFDGGTQTQIASFPLTPTGSLADATLALDGSFIYYVFDPAGPQGYSLYRVDFDGTFTLLAPLSDATEPNPLVSGLALDRRTGLLYGYESRTVAHLVTIDTATGAMAKVGNTGLTSYPNTVIMTMDFTNGGELVAARNFGNLYSIDAATGHAVPAYGSVPGFSAAIAFLPEMSPGTPFCAADGQDPQVTTACPCGNAGSAGRGCENSSSTGGARLASSGTLHPDTLVLRSEGELAGSLSILLQGNAAIATGVPFGDGVRCVGGLLVRIGATHAVGGSATWPQTGDPSISARSAALGDPIAPGSTRWYQAYYRDPVLAFCPAPPGNSFNASSGLVITW